MKIDKRLTLIGILLVVLSVTMATQYAVTKTGYDFRIVHPSDANIRYIGSDNSSWGGTRLLRVNTSIAANGTGKEYLHLQFGNWSAGMNKTYTAAFGIVNEEPFAVNITHITVSTTLGNSYMDIILNPVRNTLAGASGVRMVDNGTTLTTSSTCAWQLAAGDQDTTDMSNDGSASISTPWDGIAGVRYSIDNTTATNGTSDFIWVQISIDLPTSLDYGGGHYGTIAVNFAATTLNANR